ncbi:MAG TPA: ribonuclease D [Polyangiaceae bacterium]|nr:ribonuclease D [Polyangiaceae bacterium]
MRLLATREELNAGLKELEGAPAYYLDTEFESSKRGKRLSLVQVSRGDEVYLIDALRLGAPPISAPGLGSGSTPGPLRELGSVLCNPATQWILHAGLQDVELLLDVFESESAPRLFDTQVVWGLLGPEASVSLAFLVFRVLGIRSSKGYQADDWLRRPLPRAQLEYAAQDIAHLPALEKHLRERALQLGREPWIPEICRELLLPAPAEPLPLTFESFRNAWQLDGTGQSALRSLIEFQNSMPGDAALVQPKTLLSIASRLPASVGDLGRIKGVSPSFCRAHGARVIALLSQAKRTAPAGDALEPSDYANFDDMVREARLMLVRAELCAELSIAPDLALPMALMRRMQQRANSARDLSAASQELRGWREAVLGEGFARRVRSFAV